MKKIAVSIVLMILLSLTVVFAFFYFFLPYTTNQGKTLTVPELEGTSFEDLERNLTSRNLRYEVNADSGYDAKYPPLTILQQVPEPGDKVKENRKVYITLNSATPPQVKMPNLIDGSVKNAQVVLASYGLDMGELKYVPDLAKNSVLEQWAKGREIEPGEMIAKGTSIDLVVGNGLGNTIFKAPDLSGKELDEAEFTIKGSGLNVGSVLYGTNDTIPAGRVYKQNPAAGNNIRIGDEIDIWITETDSLNLDTPGYRSGDDDETYYDN
ncbi:MAG: PASTA domain-containing protein [Cyclobacteriaceae bacterium]